MVRYITHYKGYKIGQLPDNTFIVINPRGEYKHHAHLVKLSTCYQLIKLVTNKTVPKSPFLLTSAIRIVLEDGSTRTYIKQLKEAHRKHGNSNTRAN